MLSTTGSLHRTLHALPTMTGSSANIHFHQIHVAPKFLDA